MSDQHDFWGDVPDWSSETPRPRRSSQAERRIDDATPRPRRRLGDLWSRALSAGADPTREHGVIRPHIDDVESEPAAPAVAHARDDRWGDTPEYVELDVTAAFDDDAAWDDWAEDRPTESPRRSPALAGIDPLLARFGALVVVTTLAVPLAVGLTSDDGVDDLIASAETASEAPVPTVPVLAAPDGVAESATSVETALDPADLPPAVPVNDVDDPVEASSDSEATMTALERSDDSSSVDAARETDPAIEAGADVEAQAERQTASCAIDYTVVAGDFWIRLADASEVALDELLAVNGATIDTPLYPGSDICLPAGASVPAPPPTAAPTSAAPATTSPPATTSSTTTTSTTTSTTTTTTTTTAPPPSPLGSEEIQQIIRDVWPDDLEDRALEIAYRESRFVPTAKNYCCYGLFQIYWEVHRGWLGELGITSDQQLYDPETNARAAYALYQRAGGWGPWAL